MLTKRDVWKNNPELAESHQYQRWRHIMIRASKWHYDGGLYPLNSQRTFKCSICKKQNATYAYYPRLLFFCDLHAEWFLGINGIVPRWSTLAQKPS